MLTNAEIEAGARAEYELDRETLHYRHQGPSWDLLPQESRDYALKRFTTGCEAALQVDGGADEMRDHYGPLIAAAVILPALLFLFAWSGILFPN